MSTFKRIDVVRLTHRPGFVYTYGGWVEADSHSIAERVRALKGPARRPDLVAVPPPRHVPADSDLAARVLGLHRDETTLPRPERSPPFAVTGRDALVVAVVLGIVLLWRAL